MKYLKKQLAQGVRKVPQEKRQLLRGTINFLMEGPKFFREKGTFPKEQ
jgi:hypothetical protein